jgi:hypothetical protein
MDVLEYIRSDDNEGKNSIAAAVVIPQTALEECRNRSLVMYQRVTDLIRSSSTGKSKRAFVVFADLHHVDTQMIIDKMDGETKVNDENDAGLRKVGEYYGRAVYNHHRESNLNETKVQRNEESFVPRSLSYSRESQLSLLKILPPKKADLNPIEIQLSKHGQSK